MSRSTSAILGLGLLLFALAALSGPGRIDVVDGQARFEVARSLVTHGDTVIRDQRIWFGVFPGRDGNRYTTYRLPHSLIGAVAVLTADLTGPQSEGRRHFFFVLSSAAAAALLGMIYAGWFLRTGRSLGAAVGWAALGILCTPLWYYGTSTFDDVFGALAVVLAFLLAQRARRTQGGLDLLLAGIAVGVAFHCKPPLAIVVLPVLVAAIDLVPPLRRQARAMALILGPLLLAILAHWAYDRYKFPPATREALDQLLPLYLAPWPGDPPAGLLALLVSPGKGAIWYCPPLVLCLAGLPFGSRRRPGEPRDRLVSLAVVGASLILLVFFSSLAIFPGDPAWGPRYLVPLFALLWLYAPAGAERWGRRFTVPLLALGLVVQLASLAVDPHRLYVERGVPSTFYAQRPWIYFHPAISHLVARPREVVEILRRPEPGGAPFFTPAHSPTFAFPVLDWVDSGPRALRRYHLLSSLRPWWTSQRYLRPEHRSVALAPTVALLALLAAVGASLLWRGLGSS